MEDKKEKYVIHFNSMETPTTKIIEKVGTKEYVEYGVNNLLPNEIIDMLNNSPKAGSIINNLSRLIEGDGFNIGELDYKTINFLENNFGDEDFEIILQKCSLDLMFFGGFALNVVWSNNGERVAMVKHIPFQKVRVKNPEKSDETKQQYLISKDWADKKEAKKTIIIDEFDPENKENKSQLLYVVKYSVGLDYYTIPHWYKSVKYVKLDNEVATYQLNAAENGYTPSMMINIATGVPSREQQEEIAKKMDEKFKGSKGAKTILTFSDGKDTAPEVNMIDQNNADTKYTEVEKMILENILISNGITNPNLVGIRVPGQLGGSQELIDSFLLLQESFIKNYQKLIEKKFNLLNYYFNGQDPDLTPITIKKYNVKNLLWKE